MNIEGNASQGDSSNGPSGIHNDDLMRMLIGMMEEVKEQGTFMQQQIDFLKDGLLTAQQTAEAANEKGTTTQEPRIGSIVDFRELNPRTFSGTEEPMEAEQWITEMKTLLDTVNVPEADRVMIVKLQLTDVAKTWWIVEETLQTWCTWDQFTDKFLERFFPPSARKDLERKFDNLKQRGRPVDEYAAEFHRLRRFAPHMVETEEALVKRFRQGLDANTQKSLETFQLETYSQILTEVREIERLQGKKDKSKTAQEPRKRPHNQNQRQQRQETPPTKRATHQSSSSMACSYCQKPGHIKKDCRKWNGLCLLCGSGKHLMDGCPRKRPDSKRPSSTPPAFPSSPIEAVPLQMILPEDYQPYQNRDSEFPGSASGSPSVPAWATGNVETSST